VTGTSSPPGIEHQSPTGLAHAKAPSVVRSSSGAGEAPSAVATAHHKTGLEDGLMLLTTLCTSSTPLMESAAPQADAPAFTDHMSSPHGQEVLLGFLL
jgi:hypothetical protein